MILFFSACLQPDQNVEDALNAFEAPSPVQEEASGNSQHIVMPPGGRLVAPSPGESGKKTSQATTRSVTGQPSVGISGLIRFRGSGAGPVDLDCFVDAPETLAGRKLVKKIKLSGPGPFEARLPAGLGPTFLFAFIDQDNNGPSRNEPQGEYPGNPLLIGDKDINGVDINLTKPSY